MRYLISAGWFRMWIVISAIWLCGILILAGDSWPRKDNRVMNSLNSSSGDFIKSLPDGFRLEKLPDYNSPDFQLAMINFVYGKIIRTESDYDRHLLERRFAHFWSVGSFWILSCLALLLTGIGVSWIRAGFRKDKQNA
jgi:hypothetical protein